MGAGTISVVEDWTKRKFGKTANGYTAELEWTISYAPDQATVEATMLAQQPVAINAQCPFAPSLTCTQSGITEYNFNLSHYRATYAQLPDRLDDKTNPLTQPAFWSWEEGSRSVPIDQDVFGNPITNSAGDGFAGTAHIEKPCFFITITRNEPFFNTGLVTIINTINLNAWSPLGLPALQPGQAILRSAKPVGKYTKSPNYIVMAYRFELNPGISQLSATPNAPSLWDGFLLRVRDQGSLGWYNDSGTDKKGRFVDATFREATNVLLDGTGKPINSSFQFQNLSTGVTHTPESTPSPYNLNLSQIAVVSSSGSSGSKTLIYQTRNTYDFNQFMF